MLPAAALGGAPGLCIYLFFSASLCLTRARFLPSLAIKHSSRWRVKIMRSLWDCSWGPGRRYPQPTCGSCYSPNCHPPGNLLISISQSPTLIKKKKTHPFHLDCVLRIIATNIDWSSGTQLNLKMADWNPSWGSLAEIAAYLWHVPMFKIICENCEINILMLRTIWWHAQLKHTAIFVLLLTLASVECAPLQSFLIMQPKFVCCLCIFRIWDKCMRFFTFFCRTFCFRGFLT